MNQLTGDFEGLGIRRASRYEKDSSDPSYCDQDKLRYYFAVSNLTTFSFKDNY
jgi:hypothetical protein